MADNAKTLQDYFAEMDAAEEADAAALGLSPDTLRLSRQEPEYVKENRRASRIALEEAARTDELPKDILFDASRMTALEKAGTASVPTSLQKPREFARPNPRAALGLEKLGRQLREPVDIPETVPSLTRPSFVPAKTSDFATLQKSLSPGALTPPPAGVPVVRAASPTAPGGASAPVAEMSTSKAKDTVAPPPPPPSAPSAGAGGDDALTRLSMGQALVRALEGSGSVIAGRDLRSGAAETLGERMKQIEALRAKREEQSLEQARERSTWGASNRATLLSLMSGFKDRPEVVEALKSLGEGADTTKPPDLLRAAQAIVSLPPKIKGMEAATAGKEASTKFMTDKNGRWNQLTPGEVEKQKLQNDKLRQQIDLNAKEFTLKEKEALAKPGKDDNEKAIKLNELAEKEKGFGGYVTLANDLAELEATAPGFVTRGEAPEWLTAAAQTEGQNWPRSADPRVVKFMAAYGKLANAERHRLYGSAQTAGELKAFLQQLNDNPISGGPDVLANQMGSFAGNVGRRVTNTLTRYNSVFGEGVVDRVLGNEFRPLYEQGRVFSSYKTPFAAQTSAPTSAEGRGPKPADVEGKKTVWNKKTGQWVRYTPEQEAKARAAGAVED